jgi:outer membrane protein OmpA-like peptidoglycan-associated protein
MNSFLRSAAAFALQSALSLVLLQLATLDGATVAHAQAKEQERARAAQQRAAQQAAAQQRAAQEQARAAQQRAAQAQAAQQRAAQQRAAQEQARAAQQRAAQQQARAAQQRAAQEQARQRAAQEQGRAAQQRAAEEQARATRQREAQEQARQRAAQEQARAAQQREAQEQGRSAREQQRATREQQRAAREARAQQRAEDQARAAEQRRRATAPSGQVGQSGSEQNRPIIGQQRQRPLEARGRREEVPSQRLREVQRQRREGRQADRVVIREPDRRSIVKDQQHTFIRHDDNQRLARVVRAAQSARHGDTTALSFRSRNGARIFSEVDKEGRALRRYRRMRDGREIVLFDDRPFYRGGLIGLGTYFLDLPPPEYEVPPEQYVIDYSTASEDEIYQALAAPPIEPLTRSYALEEIRQGYQLRERMRRIELVDINFEAGSWEISPDQYPKLERLARAINHILQEHADEVFLIEGHADALDSDVDNLTLSDRRAEAVAFILSQMFGVPAENLVTQGYGDQFLKADAGKINRRVSVRRITPLLRAQDAAVATRSQSDPLPREATLDLTDDDRAFIVENLNYATEPGLGIGGISEGMRVPGGARLRSFPAVIRDRLPALEAYRYFVAESQIAVVDPTSAQVAAVIDANR